MTLQNMPIRFWSYQIVYVQMGLTAQLINMKFRLLKDGPNGWTGKLLILISFSWFALKYIIAA